MFEMELKKNAIRSSWEASLNLVSDFFLDLDFVLKYFSKFSIAREVSWKYSIIRKDEIAWT